MFEALGNLGDFIGGIAVVVTLVFLIRQLRSNTISVRTATYQAAVDTMSNLAGALARDPAASELYARGSQDRASLSDLDRTRFDLLILSVVRAYENLHFQHRHGAIEDEEWEGWENRIRSHLLAPGVQRWWSEQRLAFNPVFRDFVEAEPDRELPRDITAAGLLPAAPRTDAETGT